MVSLPGHFLTRGLVMAFPVTWLPPPVSYSPVGAQTHKTRVLGLLQLLPGDFRSNYVTSGHVRSCDVISCHVTAISCELQPCRCSNIPKTWLMGLLQPLPGDSRANDATSGWLPVTWGHVTSFPATWLLPPASYSPVGAQTYPKLDL